MDTILVTYLSRILCRNLSCCSHTNPRGCSDSLRAAKSQKLYLCVGSSASLAGVVGLGEFFSPLDEEETVFATQVFLLLDKDSSGALDLYKLHAPESTPDV